MKQISDNEIYLLIKYIKSVLWRLAKLLSYIENAVCLKVKAGGAYSYHCILNAKGTVCFPYASSLISPSCVSVDRLDKRRFAVC